LNPGREKKEGKFARNSQVYRHRNSCNNVRHKCFGDRNDLRTLLIASCNINQQKQRLYQLYSQQGSPVC